MKKLLVIPLLIICFVLLGGCKNEGKDAIIARCDEFITIHEGTEHDDYRIDNIEYKLLSVNKGNSDYIVEIVWYFDVSGNYDMMSVLKEWTDITLDALNDIEISTHTFDVIYYKDSLNDALTVVVNGEAAYSGADLDNNREYYSAPPTVTGMDDFGIVINAILFLASVVLLCWGWVKARTKSPLFWGGVGALVLASVLMIFGSSDFLNLIYIIGIVLAIVVAFTALAVFLNKKNNKKYMDFYKKCAEYKISDPSSKSQAKEFLLIAKNYGFKDENSALKAFEKSKKIIAADNEKNLKKREKELAKQKKEAEYTRAKNLREECSKYLEEKKFTEYRGKDKYLRVLRDKLADAKDEVSDLKHTKVDSPYMSTEGGADWAVAGGIASAIGGTAAGVAVALDVQRRNAEHQKNAEEWNKLVAMSGITKESLQEAHDDKLSDSKAAVEKYKNEIDKINNKLVDDSDQQGKMKLLKFNITGKLTENGMLMLDVTPKQIGKIEVLGSPAILDGSVRILVQKKGRTIGDAYYNAPDFNEYTTDKVGFLAAKRRKVIALPLKGKTFDSEQGLTYKVEPVYLWAIEK